MQWNQTMWLLGCVAIALVFFAIFTRNDMVVARNRVRAAWSNIDVQLQRRHDLIPQLVTCVKAYADHERATLASIAELRGRAQAGGSIDTRGKVEQELGGKVSRLLALQENYPELKASENFLQLQRDLVDTENQLQQARDAYNDTVREYNDQIQKFPEVLLATPFGFSAAEFFQAENTAAVKL